MTDRRLPRSRRTLAAITLLVLATAFVVVAVMAGTLVPVAAVVAAIAGVLVHSLESAELTDVHEQWSGECAGLRSELRTAEQRRLAVTADLVNALTEVEQLRLLLGSASFGREQSGGAPAAGASVVAS